MTLIRLAANLSLMFTDRPFLERFAAAAAAGFTGVEFMFPYAFPAAEVAARAEACGLPIILFNIPAGDWDAGERGIAALPDRIEEQRRGVSTGLDYARILQCRQLHLMAGKAPVDDLHAGVLLDNLVYAADLAATHAVDILVEPINTRVDIPGYFLSHSRQAADLVAACGRSNVRLQYDVYHMQIMEGDLARHVEALLPIIGHMQLADNPGRAEPGTGEINYTWLLRHIDALGYAGWIGCEYRPLGDTGEGLAWARPYLSGTEN
ncbi:hydroxypyruvate isomerase [Sphingomonas sp. DBB INV C78]|uniref:2-oxo-tetronate isomerase n=1 Tax=Sphingomonas sp. DBB INV C78 TaxID=3349434 RepID=UPI0036D27983